MPTASTNLLLLMVLLFAPLHSSHAQKVFRVSPYRGSRGGATRVTITGEGFAQGSQFQLNPANSNFGNRVTFMSSRGTELYPCPVERDSTHGTQIMCYTPPMPYGTYYVKVTVDGKEIHNRYICGGRYWAYPCVYIVHWTRSPNIRSLDRNSGTPGSVVTIRAMMFTDAFGSSNRTSTNGIDSRILRAYMGGMPCELLKPDSDELYRLELDNENSWWGHMSCNITGTYIGVQNMSYIADGDYGRSTPETNVYHVGPSKKMGMFQTYAEVTGVTPSQGSVKGGTILTIHGRYLGDQTDHPARVVVGGLPCEVLHVADDKILCKTPEQPNEHMDSAVGGTGLKMEVWNNSRPASLAEIWTYNENTTGYWSTWVRSMSHIFPHEFDRFTSKISGFLVPPSTGNYILHLHCDDRCELYLSNSSRPEHKRKIAFQPRYVQAFKLDSQQSEPLHFEMENTYYIEIIMQEYYGAASYNLAMFSEESFYNEAQTKNAVNEVQTVIARYDIENEQQIVTLEQWVPKSAVEEVQRVSIVSSGSMLFSLGCGLAETASLSVSDNAAVVEAALNDLWSIKPDRVQVSKNVDSDGTHFTVTFKSDRGDFPPLSYNNFGSDINITVVEVTKGQSNGETFTLLWDGIPTSPIPFNASEEEVQSAVEDLLSAKCPGEIMTSEGSDVKYFKDFENDFDNSELDGTRVKNGAFCGSYSRMNFRVIFKESYPKESGGQYGSIPLNIFSWLCFAYKGSFGSEFKLQFTYRNSQGATVSETATVPIVLNQGPNWSYKCVDLLTPLQSKYAGSRYQMTKLTLVSDADNYIDAIHIGREPTAVVDEAIPSKRKPPPFELSLRFFDDVSVSKDASAVSYQISARPADCAFGFPMMEIGFMEMTQSSEDTAEFREGTASVTITRPHKATPPLNGSFDLEIEGEAVEGLSINIDPVDLKYLLEAVPGVGELDVRSQGSCREPKWRIEWLSKPGIQPLIKTNSSNIIGSNVNLFSRQNVKGGMLQSQLFGNIFHVMEKTPQAVVFINDIPSWCSGDCSFQWTAEKTPVLTGISPSQGSDGLGTLLTISGTGFSNEHAIIMVGKSKCNVKNTTATTQVCALSRSVAGTFPVTVTFPSLGTCQYFGDNVLYFTYQLIISSFSPLSGSLAGDTLMTINGFGFSLSSTVTMGNKTCEIVKATETELKCRTPPGMAGAVAVAVSEGNMTETAAQSFTYDIKLTPQISSTSPKTTSVSGRRVLTIEGSNLGTRDSSSAVEIGGEECVVLEWIETNITCLLPVLPPGLYHVDVQVLNNGNALISNGVNASIEYILEIHSISPLVGSLMGGTKLTITGSGFGQDMAEIGVSIGGVECEVTTASEDELECALQSGQKTITVTNQGIHPQYGQGFAWEPASFRVHSGDKVVWQWTTSSFLSLNYGVFSVSRPSGCEDEGGFFSSGAKTPNGQFAYVFSEPGDYFFSSGFVDRGKSRCLHGKVQVLGREEQSNTVALTVSGVEAKRVPSGSHRARRSTQSCVASPVCPQSQSSSGISFTSSPCATPTVLSISPNQGTYHQVIHIQGHSFGNVSCAIEVTVGGEPCHVINSTNTDIYCQLSADSQLPIGVAHAVALKVNNLGSALISIRPQMQSRFVLLPVVDSVWPSIGSTNGYTRLTVHGSGFSRDTVTAAGRSCNILSANYTHITCDTSSSPINSGDVVYQSGSIRSTCHSDCNYEYSSAVTPTVSRLSTYSVSGPSTVEIIGVGFGNSSSDVYVTVGTVEAGVIAVADDNVTISTGALVVGGHRVKVIVRSKGLAHRQFTVTSVAVAKSLTQVGSVEGGTPLVVTGNGFAPGNTNVTIGGNPCAIQNITPGELRCLTPPHSEGSQQVHILVSSQAYPTLTFNYSLGHTPVVTSASPATGSSGTLITLNGTGFGTDQQLISVSMNHVACSVSSVTDSQVQCTAGNNPGGPHPIMLHHGVKGYAQSQASFNYELTLSGVKPNEGSFGGGALLSVEGSGFDPNTAVVHVCGQECPVDRASATSSQLSCYSPFNNGTESELSCVVSVSNPTQTINVSSGFTYKSQLTPVISEVSPRRGGTAGGVLLTITGTGFSTNMTEVSVTIAGVVCDVQSANATHILCVTNAQRQSQKTKVHVSIRDQGLARLDNADFFYIDVWSSRYTWGNQSPPEKGTFAVITKNQTILLDTSTPVLKLLLIQGGTLIFDEADIELQAENILITDGGALQIGTEEQPFQHQAIITLHGNLRSPELPVYGTKALGVREGKLDMHGIPVPVPWTRLAETAQNGSSTLKLKDAVTWKQNDTIVIASTGHRHSQRENEVRQIASVSQDGRTLSLTEPLQYKHLGVEVTLADGTLFEARAEVGLLSRNVIFRGSKHMEWDDKIEACPDGFNTGEFATQTCFQGRFGEETGSDQFGAHIMFHAPEPDKNLAMGRLSNVEITHAGQAFRLGRYPIHWHLMGNINYKSYVRSCAIHHTFNRAVTIHNTHNLLVEYTVLYDVMGGAFFIEDGIETGNILQYNLAVFVRQSTSLLNDDVTPAAYWVTNPNNIIRHNAAAGGTHFGFWYRMHEHPDGPSYDPDICQKKVPLGQFENNTVHSQGWFGLWVFPDYFPMENGNCRSKNPQPAVFKSLTTWHCEKGAEWVDVGSLHFEGFVMVGNEKAGTEHKRIMSFAVSNFGPDGGAVVSNSIIVGHLGELGMGENYCTHRGILAPLDDGFSVINTTFINFDRSSCAAFGVVKIDGTSGPFNGGWAVRTSGIKYLNVRNKAGFRWENEVQLVDLDGSLTGHVNYKVVPTSALLDPAHCTQSAEWSAAFNGSVCDETVNFHRLAFNNPSPSSLAGKDVLLTNRFGSIVSPFMKKRMSHKPGWMALLPSGETYWWRFIDAAQITNISYTAGIYGFKSDEFVIIAHNFTQSPDRFRIVDERNGSSSPLTFSQNENGDWYFDESENAVYYMVSGKTSNPRRTLSADPALRDVDVTLRVYRCFYPNCIEPTPAPPATLPPLPDKRPADFRRWSDASFWKTSADNNNTVPGEGADVVISAGEWVVLDTSTPPLNKLTVKGVLEIPDDLNTTTSRRRRSTASPVVLSATYIFIEGGRLLAGWPDSPFEGELHIKLKGNHYTPDWPLPNGPNMGSKALGVFGTLELYGKSPNVYHTKLSATSAAGSNTLTLAKAVDWQVGDEVAISTTSYNPWETEKRQISAVSSNGLVLTLDEPLTYTHIGETHTVAGTGHSYTLAADVGLLTRNIKIIGEEYPQMMEESFGARVLVGSFSFGGIDYKGKAQIRNVEFYRTGQEGWTDFFDPRYSVSFLDLNQVEDTYLKGCSFHDGFSPAIGVFGTEGLIIDDNVVHHTVGEGIRIWGHNITVRRNLVMMTLWTGSYQDREEPFNWDWNAGIEVNEGTAVVLQHNIVAGYERVAYRIDGEPCAENHNEMWLQNEAHGGLYGVYMNKDGFPGCSLIREFFIWKCFDFGIYFQVIPSVTIANVTLVDNGLGVMPIIYGPPSLSHRFEDKRVNIQSSLFVGSSPNLNYSETMPSSDYNIINSATHRADRPPTGGRAGIGWPNFNSGHNTAPKKPHALNMAYNTIKGLMTVTDTTFVGFKSVSSGEENFMFITNTKNEDLQHPIYTTGIRIADSSEDNKVFIHRPDLGKVNPADCVDMDCDAKKKSMLKDLDGSFLGAVGAVVPQSEFEWDGDPRRGLGDYRIPKVMLTFLNGSRIPVEQIAPHKGVIRKNCTYMDSWQSYKCFDLNYKMLAIESLDADTELRRLSPVALLGDGFVDLINGPQDHGWCSGYTCQKRLSLFHAIVATGYAFDIFFSSTSPQKLRLMMINGDPSESVLLSIYYSKPQRLDVFVNNRLVAPTNAEWNDDQTDYTLKKPMTPDQYVPKMNATAGSNFFDQDYKMLKVLVSGPVYVEIRTSPVLFLSFSLPAMTEEEFFGDNLVNNLAVFLKVPPNMIRITNIVRADGGARRRKRSTGLSVEVEIKKPPVQQTTNATNDEEDFTLLKNIADDLGQAAVSGNLSRSIGFNVSSMGMRTPPPSASDPEWNEVATEEETREESTLSYVSSVENLLLMEEPIAGEYVGPLYQQPSLKAVDQNGDCVAVGVTTLTVAASLKDSSGNAVTGLEGNATIKFKTCWANFTDLSLANSGENLTMVFTLKDWGAQSRSFSVKAVPTTDPPTTSSNTTSNSTTPSATTTAPAPTSDITTPGTPTAAGTTGAGTTMAADTTDSMTTVTTGTTEETTEDGSVFGSASTLGASSLCAISVIYAAAYCSEIFTVF